MARERVLTGDLLRQLLAAATARLDGESEAVNAINVYPVPDGDTGTNMLLTMRAATEAAEGGSVAEVARSAARGALLGARGNSGVILSQYLRGLADGLAGQAAAEPAALARALGEAARAAYAAVSQPVEGTILTVARESAEAAAVAAERPDADIAGVLEETARAAYAAVQRTPELLPALAQAGVVDAGGQGLFLILEGAALRDPAGRLALPPSTGRSRALIAPEGAHGDGGAYGYCTEFVVMGATVEREGLQARLSALGDSLIVVGEGDLLRVHIHTDDPGRAMSLAAPLGRLARVKVDDMEAQHAAVFGGEERGALAPLAVVAVAAGDGWAEVFRSAGAAAVVRGGQTMNPSAAELLEGIRSARAALVLVLPNNGNVVLTAEQAAGLAECEVRVVRTVSMPGGVAALLAFNAERDEEKNAAAMATAAGLVRVAEVTRAVRDASIGGVTVRRGQAMAMIDGDLRTTADNEENALLRALALMRVDATLATVYTGSGIDEARAAAVTERARVLYPEVEVEVVRGGQPAYAYVLAVE